MKSFKAKVGQYVADCREIDSFPYKNGAFSFGLVRGLPHRDNIYFEIKKNGKWERHYIKEDEAMAMVAGLSRALWMEYGLRKRKKLT